MKEKRPMLVTFIADLTLFYAFLFILAVLPIHKIFEKVNIYFSPMSGFIDWVITILNIIILLTIAYGYYKIKGWAYYLLLSYNLFFLTTSIIFMLTQTKPQYSMPGFTECFLGLMLTYPSKRYFIKQKPNLEESK